MWAEERRALISTSSLHHTQVLINPPICPKRKVVVPIFKRELFKEQGKNDLGNWAKSEPRIRLLLANSPTAFEPDLELELLKRSVYAGT